MNPLLKSFAPDTELTNSIGQIKTIQEAFDPYKISLSNEQRTGLRIVGPSRMGLVEMISRIARIHDEKLAKNVSAADLDACIGYMRLLRDYKQIVMRLYEAIDDTDKALGKDIMNYVDKFSSDLQSARKYDGDLDDAMKEVDDYNARFGRIMEAEDIETSPGATPATGNS